MATSAPRAAARNVAAAANAETPASSKKMLYLVLALVTVIVLGSAAVWYFLVYTKPAHAATTVKVAPPPVFMPLDVFTVNLQTDGGDQFLQVALTLQVADQIQVEQFTLYMPEVRNRLLLLLSSKQADDILTVEGKRILADEIVASLQKPFVPQGQKQAISRVFFTSFVVQ